MRPLRFLPCLLLLSSLLHADATRQDWFGSYALNQDGHLATLSIFPSRTKCAIAVPCSNFQVQYTDDQGNLYPVTSGPLDDNGQHLTLTVQFPGNPQQFDLYLFSFDKTRLAGTTVWGGRTFGVEAVKSAPSSPYGDRRAPLIGRAMAGTSSAPAGSPLASGPERSPASRATASSGGTSTGAAAPVLSADGTIVLHDPDGTIRTKHPGICGWIVQAPDGKITKKGCMQAISVQRLDLPDPPVPAAGSPQAQWLSAQDTSSSSILQALLGGSQSANYQNYLSNYENSTSTLYRKITSRMQMIYTLTSAN